MHILRETLIITFWSFWTSVIIGAGLALLLHFPLTATYMMAVLTIAPALAILRGRNRDRDRLELSERAAVELLSLGLLMAIGWAAGRYLGK